jgi:two-component system sensor histidine kinase HydH
MHLAQLSQKQTTRVLPSARDVGIWFVLLALAVITSLHYLTDVHLIPYHSIYRSLYYLPIAVAAVRYGRIGGTTTALATSALYLPHVWISWGTMPSDGFNDLLENVVFLFVGVLAGTLADAQRAQRQRAEQAVEELERSYAQLQEQSEQIRRAERQGALGRLAGGLAHEIRNPLAVVRAAAQMLHTDVPAAQQCYTGVMQSEISRVDRLIEELLRYAEPRPFLRGPVDVTALVTDTVQLCAPYAAQLHVTITSGVAPALTQLTGDADHLKQALLNVLLNAVQATPPGGIVTVRASASSDGCLVLTVQDTGSGIPEDQRSRIFDPFFTTRDDGTGLGLALVQQIVQEHGGRVDVGDPPEGAALLIITLPPERTQSS